MFLESLKLLRYIRIKVLLMSLVSACLIDKLNNVVFAHKLSTVFYEKTLLNN